MTSSPDTEPDVDALVDELRRRVEQRRRDGDYPPGLEDDLAVHFEVMMHRGMRAPRPVDLHGALGRIAAALPVEAARISTDSRSSAGSALHQAVAKVVGRQTEGALQQVQAFAQPVAEALGGLTTLFEDLAREVRDDLSARLDAVLERQAAYERWMVSADGPPAPHAPPPPPTPAETQARQRELAARLAGATRSGPGPVLDFGPGDGDLLDVLAGAPDASLAGVVLVQVVESLPTRSVVTLAELCAAKLRPGGEVLVDTASPQAVFGRAPEPGADTPRALHPAYLTFLFAQAGFACTAIEWRDDGPPAAGPAGGAAELKRRLYAPRDYLLSAVR